MVKTTQTRPNFNLSFRYMFRGVIQLWDCSLDKIITFLQNQVWVRYRALHVRRLRKNMVHVYRRKLLSSVSARQLVTAVSCNIVIVHCRYCIVRCHQVKYVLSRHLQPYQKRNEMASTRQRHRTAQANATVFYRPTVCSYVRCYSMSWELLRHLRYGKPTRPLRSSTLRALRTRPDLGFLRACGCQIRRSSCI